MYIDAVAYIHYLDFHAGQKVFFQFQRMMAARNVKFMHIYDLRNGQAKLAVIELNEGMVKKDGQNWIIERSSLNETTLELALQLRKSEANKENFLISERPEIIETIKVFNGTHYPSYPTRLKQIKLGVELLDSIRGDNDLVKSINREVAETNAMIMKAFENYPYPFEFISFRDDPLQYNSGFQYVLRFMNTSGKTIKHILNYQVDNSETDFITTIPLPDNKRTFKTIPIEQPVYKFYIKQTTQSDVHVGRYWDADPDLYMALTYFLGNMTNFFEK
jgi:hypothetical protein